MKADGVVGVLIETYWNVKYRWVVSALLPSRINRNILECKEIRTNGTFGFGYGINRNILECKDSC